MQKIHFSIHIDAPKEKVWNTMLDDATYREWTLPFNPGGSRYEGNWEEGSEIRFLAANAQGGMFSRIKENRPYEYISIEHLGMIDQNGVVDTTSDEVKKWTPAFENYTLTATDTGTEVSVDMDINDEYKDMFSDTWPRALSILKTLAEK
jgi:uncharacterized protein YndB with AHSA1/START domain